ncbi:MAG: tetratricopeptide repeat protein [Planctomycetota bacterium]|nr:tetratricopeptide repeat protein [Planctomycetota bacterium]
MNPILPWLLSAAASASPFAPPLPSNSVVVIDEPSAEVADLVTRGRALLRGGRAEQAQALLDEALSLDVGRARTRVWVVRCWIARGRINDALDACDELSAAGESGAHMDYLYGLAFHGRAKEYIRLASNGQMIEMNFRDSMTYLRAATEADAAAYPDAYRALAESAWYAQDLAVGREAAARALELRPEGVFEAYILGRLALSQFSAARGDEARAEEAQAAWQAAADAFRLAIANAGEPSEAAQRQQLAKAHLQLAYAHQWKAETEPMLAEYSQALRWDPSIVDLSSLWSAVTPEQFTTCVAAGRTGFSKVWGGGSGDGAMAWWLAYARLAEKDHAQAQALFEEALEKLPTYHATWWYLGLARYHQQDFDGAIEAFSELQARDPAAGGPLVAANRGLHLSILGFLVGRCAVEQRNAEAGRLCDLYVAAEPANALYWSYVGLFYRDAGDGLRRARQAADRTRREAFWERAWVGYSTALELEPANPAYLNDGAVILHYCLERDLDVAADMYERAFALAEELLARDDLSEELRDLYRIARRDSRNNLAKLKAGRGGG